MDTAMNYAEAEKVPYEYRRVLNPTFVPSKKSRLSEEDTAHINVCLDQIQSPLAYINIVKDKPWAVKEQDIPAELGCRLLDVKHSREGFYMTLQRNDVVFAIYRNHADDDLAFSEKEPYIISKNITVRDNSADKVPV